jgi:hypothetical protein
MRSREISNEVDFRIEFSTALCGSAGVLEPADFSSSVEQAELYLIRWSTIGSIRMDARSTIEGGEKNASKETPDGSSELQERGPADRKRYAWGTMHELYQTVLRIVSLDGSRKPQLRRVENSDGR